MPPKPKNKGQFKKGKETDSQQSEHLSVSPPDTPAPPDAPAENVPAVQNSASMQQVRANTCAAAVLNLAILVGARMVSRV